MMELFNELLTTLVKIVVTAGGSYLIAYGLPWLKKISLYKMVQIGVMAAEKLAESGVIKKVDKNAKAKEILGMLGIKVTPMIDAMIEAAVKELDNQENKIKSELKKD